MSPGPGRRSASRALVGVVAALAAALIVWALPATVRFAADAPSAFWAIALMAVLVDIPVLALIRHIAEPTRTILSVSFTFAIFLVYGAAPAIVVQALAAGVAAIGQRRSVSSGIFLASRLVCALAAAEGAVVLTTGRPLTAQGTGLTGHDLAGFLLPAAVWFLVSFGLLAAGRVLFYDGRLRDVIVEVREDVFATAASLLLLSALLTTMTDWWVVLVALPVFAWNQLSREYARHEQRMRREPVTGLLNQRGLMLGMETFIAPERVLDTGRQRALGLVFINVQSVLDVNRSLGRGLYEKIIAGAGRRLTEVYGSDRVGRLSGEGFVILAPGMTEDDAVAEASRGVAALQPPIEVSDIPFALDPVAGVALSPQHGHDFGILIAKAELAVGQARRTGMPAAVYERQSRDVTERRIALLAELRATLRDPGRHAEIEVRYQPQVRLGTGQLVGAEALLRWTHPRWGPVPTDELIEAVEPSEVMHLLTQHMLERVCGQLHTWNRRGLRIRVAVNASVRDLHDPQFPGLISHLLATNDLAPDQLTVEITERTLASDTERVARAGARIAELGVGLSLDDFGTGYASMQQLRSLPLTEVKVDKSYVAALTTSASQWAIVTSVHQLASALKLAVVAEGVEDERTASALAELPGTIGQGWYFGKPVPAEEFEQRWSHQADSVT